MSLTVFMSPLIASTVGSVIGAALGDTVLLTFPIIPWGMVGVYACLQRWKIIRPFDPMKVSPMAYGGVLALIVAANGYNLFTALLTRSYAALAVPLLVIPSSAAAWALHSRATLNARR